MEYIPAEEAASILNISVRQLRREVRKGMLRQVFPDGQKVPYYDPEEVAFLANLRTNKISLPEVAAAAQRTQMYMMRLEKRMNQLMTAVGADIPCLPLDKEYLTSLYFRVQDAVEPPRQHSLKEVLEWSGIFATLGEEHLQGIETYMGIEEPWRPFAELSMRLFSGSPNNLRNDPGADAVYRVLNVSRDKLRRTLGMYLTLKHGPVLTHRMFPQSKNDVHNDILALVIEKRRKRDQARRKSS